MPFLRSRLLIAFELFLTFAILRGFWFVASYQSTTGDILAFGKNLSHLLVSGLWLTFIAFWIAFLFKYKARIPRLTQVAIYLLYAIEAVPYVFTFGLLWPYEWPRNWPRNEPHEQWCAPGWVLNKKEYYTCGTKNAFGNHDEEHAIPKPNGLLRIAYTGNSQVEGIAIPLEKKASKIAQKLLREKHPQRALEIMDIYTSGMSTVDALEYLGDQFKKFDIDALVLKSLGEEPSLSEAEHAELNQLNQKRGVTWDPSTLYQNKHIQKLIHAPASNLISFLVWRGLKFFVGTYDPEKARLTRKEELEELPSSLQNQCELHSTRLAKAELARLNGLLHTYSAFEKKYPHTLPVFILQIPEVIQEIPVSQLSEKRLACEVQIAQFAFDEVFKNTKNFHLINAGKLMLQQKVAPMDLSFPEDGHLNEKGNAVVGAAMAEGLQWFF